MMKPGRTLLIVRRLVLTGATETVSVQPEARLSGRQPVLVELEGFEGTAGTLLMRATNATEIAAS